MEHNGIESLNIASVLGISEPTAGAMEPLAIFRISEDT